MRRQSLLLVAEHKNTHDGLGIIANATVDELSKVLLEVGPRLVEELRSLSSDV